MQHNMQVKHQTIIWQNYTKLTRLHGIQYKMRHTWIDGAKKHKQ